MKESEKDTNLITRAVTFFLLSANIYKVVVAIADNRLALGYPHASACTPKRTPYSRQAERE